MFLGLPTFIGLIIDYFISCSSSWRGLHASLQVATMYRGILIVGGIAIAVGFGLIIFKGKMEEDSELQHQHEAEERTLRSVWDGKLLYQKTWEPTGPPRSAWCS